jgi:hypothetical protein
MAEIIAHPFFTLKRASIETTICIYLLIFTLQQEKFLELNNVQDTIGNPSIFYYQLKTKANV